MKKLLIAAFAANVILSAIALYLLPGRVAIHFGPGGEPDGWSSGPAASLIQVSIHGVVLAALLASPALTPLFPRRWVSIPHKDYWLTPRNIPLLVRILEESICEFGVVMFIFLFWTGLLNLSANLSQPVRFNERAFLPMLTAFLLYTAVWVYRLYTHLRVPAVRDDPARTADGSP